MVNNYKIRGGNVQAYRNDGTDESAKALYDWVVNTGGEAELYPKGTQDYDLDNAYVQIASPRPQKIVGPGWWVVRTEDGFYFALNSMDFAIVYEEIMPEGETPPEFNWGKS